MPYYKVPASDLPAMIDTLESRGERIVSVVTLPGGVAVITEPPSDRMHVRGGAV